MTPLPEVTFSPDGRLAYFGSGNWHAVLDLETNREVDAQNVPAHDGSPVTIDDDRYELDGTVRALERDHDGESILALVTHDDGSSSLVRLLPVSGEVETIARDLDAPLRGNTIGAAPDGDTVYLALASDGPVDLDARHDPDADRDLGIYAVDRTTGALELVIDTPMDELSPKVVGEHLYWTRVDYRQSIVALPIAGGEAHVVADGGQLPYWRHDGRAIGFTVGLPLAADAPLNMDVDVIDVDDAATPTSAPRRLIAGYHEDFTPAWSPDGSRLAFHSHRSPTAVPAYQSDGSTDDLYLLASGARVEDEIRLTDFGWEIGMADWAPDGERLVFVTWEEGAPGIGVPYVATLDGGFERLTLPEPLRSARLVAWSPAAEAIAIENDDGDGRQSIWTLDLETGDVQLVVEYASDTYSGLDWTPDGESIVFSALAGDTYQIHRVAVTGGEPELLSRDTAQLMQPQVSPDGRFIAATRIDATRELWRRRR